MSHICCSGNFSSCSFGGHLHYPSSSCGSSYPSNLIYTMDLCSPSTCQLSSSLYSGCQETCCEPTRCQMSHGVPSPCQSSCYCPGTSTFCSPCWTNYAGSLGSGSGKGYSLVCRSRSCGSSGSLGSGVSGFPSLSRGSCHPIYVAS
ncbi:keratin-associated protein 13-1-like [Camelus bactrianus]|uniref:Keratin-associated protein n=1 Tax=Camelus bactrianus TaxID=9837 RepID=A0A9W3ESK2_CAMBA|nr:keratin-associated protein 13-1-like [Camelus bactrianus]